MNRVVFPYDCGALMPIEAEKTMAMATARAGPHGHVAWFNKESGILPDDAVKSRHEMALWRVRFFIG